MGASNLCGLVRHKPNPNRSLKKSEIPRCCLTSSSVIKILKPRNIWAIRKERKKAFNELRVCNNRSSEPFTLQDLFVNSPDFDNHLPQFHKVGSTKIHPSFYQDVCEESLSESLEASMKIREDAESKKKGYMMQKRVSFRSPLADVFDLSQDNV